MSGAGTALWRSACFAPADAPKPSPSAPTAPRSPNETQRPGTLVGLVAEHVDENRLGGPWGLEGHIDPISLGALRRSRLAIECQVRDLQLENGSMWVEGGGGQSDTFEVGRQ